MMRIPKIAIVGLALITAVAVALIPRARLMPAMHATAAAPSDAMTFTRSLSPSPASTPSVAGTAAPAVERTATAAPASQISSASVVGVHSDAAAFAPTPSRDGRAEDPPPGHAGMIASIDAEGRLSAPTAAQRAALERTIPALDRSDIGLEIISLPNGAEMMRLDGRFMEYAVARVDAQGRFRMDCVQGPEVESLLHRDTPANTPVER